MNPVFYGVETREWAGDYGSTLISGIVTNSEGDTLKIARAGPFIPPITLPSFDYVVVTEPIRAELQQFLGRDVCFRPVTLERVVELIWQEWLDLDELPVDKAWGDPEDQILRGTDSRSTAKCMGPLFEALLPTGARVNFGEGISQYLVDPSTWTGVPLFYGQAPGGNVVMATDVGKEWLERHGGPWLRFVRAQETTLPDALYESDDEDGEC